MIDSIFELICGLGIFLYSINIMSEKINETFGDKIKTILQKTAKTKTGSILTGTLVTAVLQSSSAVTVMLVPMAEKGIVSLFQAVGIIMGANIGTTVTSLLIAADFSALSPLFVFFGAVLKLFSGKEKLKSSGEVILSFGLLFVGLSAMSDAFTALRDNPFFLNIIVSSSGKIGGILSGILMTVIIQSSSASVGILQSLCRQGLVSLTDAVYIISGQNIGTVATVLIASAGMSRKARQIGKIHLIFNIVGSVFFLVAGEFIPFGQWLSVIKDPSLAVAVFHIVFNIVNTVILLPFYERLSIGGERKKKAPLDKICH